MSYPIWGALLLAYGALCGWLGAAISTWTRHRPGAGLLPGVATMAAMNTLRANHPGEFARLLGAETTRLAGRTASGRQDGGDHA